MRALAALLFLATAATVAAAAAAAAAAGGTREEEAPVTVDVEGLGRILGKGTITARGAPIFKFLGIPFAKKPDYFKPPTEFGSWSGDLDAQSPAPGCPGLPVDALGDLLSVDVLYPGASAAAAAAAAERAGRAAGRDEAAADPDDCLTLDIYTHSVSGEKRAPVLFYVHGGAFVLGTSQMANGDFLLDHGDIVLVSVQYRLGPPGFLAAAEADAPGNGALHDLVWALRWVRAHVAAFGGDPDHIVVGGVSAGAALSGLLVVSPEVRDWVKGAALFSGGALVPWALDADPYRSTRGVGVFAGCLRPDSLAECLRSRSGALLNVAWGLWTVYEKYFVSHGMGGVIPTVDADSEHPLLPRAPLVEMQDENFPGKPMLIGVTQHEGTFVLAQMDLLYIKARGLAEDEKTLIHDVGDLLLEFSDAVDPLFTLGDAVKRLYFCEESLGNYTAMFEGLVDFTGAGFFKGPAQRMGRLNAAAGGESYLFTFDYARENAQSNSLMGGDERTVHHGSDQYFLFNSGAALTPRDMQVVDIYSELVVSFVTDLKPHVEGVDWRPNTVLDDVYLSMRLPPEARQGFSSEYYVMETERQLEQDGGSSEETNEPDSPSTETDPTPTEADSGPTETDPTPTEADSGPTETDPTPNEVGSPSTETDSTTKDDTTLTSVTADYTTEDAATAVPLISMLLLILIPLTLT